MKAATKHNHELGQDRADAVKRYLNQRGIAQSHVDHFL
jgi:outer membrane protein OmpA-like peptidoglycan-associated protein